MNEATEFTAPLRSENPNCNGNYDNIGYEDKGVSVCGNLSEDDVIFYQIWNLTAHVFQSFGIYAKQTYIVAIVRECFNFFKSVRCKDVIFDKYSHDDASKLAISAPPRHGKSLICSVIFAAWAIGVDPTTKIIIFSNTRKLAQEQLRRCREIMEMDFYKIMFPNVATNKRVNRIDHFGTTEGGQIYATSMRAGAIGMGGDFVIIDDPHNPNDVFSEKKLRNPFDYYQTVVRSRLNPSKRGGIMVCMQRIHQDDFISCLENEDKNWNFLSFQIKADYEQDFSHLFKQGTTEYRHFEDCFTIKEGDILNSRTFTPQAVENLQNSIDYKIFEAQYMQKPFEYQQGIICEDHLKEFHLETIMNDSGGHIIQSWDTANTAQQGNYSVCTIWKVFNPFGDNKNFVYINNTKYGFMSELDKYGIDVVNEDVFIPALEKREISKEETNNEQSASEVTNSRLRDGGRLASDNYLEKELSSQTSKGSCHPTNVLASGVGSQKELGVHLERTEGIPSSTNWNDKTNNTGAILPKPNINIRHNTQQINLDVIPPVKKEKPFINIKKWPATELYDNDDVNNNFNKNNKNKQKEPAGQLFVDAVGGALASDMNENCHPSSVLDEVLSSQTRSGVAFHQNISNASQDSQPHSSPSNSNVVTLEGESLVSTSSLHSTGMTAALHCHPSHIPISGVGSYKELAMHSESNVIPALEKRGISSEHSDASENNIVGFHVPNRYGTEMTMPENDNTKNTVMTNKITKPFNLNENHETIPQPRYYLIDVIRKKVDYPELKKLFIQQYKKYGGTVIIEEKASGKQLIDEIADSNKSGHTNIPLFAMKPDRGKQERLNDIMFMFEQGSVYVPSASKAVNGKTGEVLNAWVKDYKREILNFPCSKHDDQVDSTSQFLNWIRKMREKVQRQFFFSNKTTVS